jgi:hypothetical protein
MGTYTAHKISCWDLALRTDLIILSTPRTPRTTGQQKVFRNNDDHPPSTLIVCIQPISCYHRYMIIIIYSTVLYAIDLLIYHGIETIETTLLCE